VKPFEDALQIVLDHAPVLDAQETPLAEALGLVLAEDVASDMDMPPFDKSAMDGYAVVAADTANAPVILQVLETIAAGQVAKEEVRPGAASRIMTGAMVPRGANSVVIVENTRPQGDGVEILETIAPRKNICWRGEDVRTGQRLLARGTRLRPQEIGVCASAGAVRVRVHRRPVVALLTTGAEIVPPRRKPGPGQIRDSNTSSISAQIAAHRGIYRPLGIAPDEPDQLRAKIRQGLDADVLLLSGGVSMGTYDFVKDCLRKEGVSLLFERVRIKPGKPTVFGIRGDTLVFGLPGNPVSTLVTFETFVSSALRRMMGRSDPRPKFIQAVYEGEDLRRAERRSFRPGVLRFGADGCRVAAVEYHGSADLAATTRANAFLVVPEGEGPVSDGEQVAVLCIE